MVLLFFVLRAQLARGWPSAAPGCACTDQRNPDDDKAAADTAQDNPIAECHGKLRKKSLRGLCSTLLYADVVNSGRLLPLRDRRGTLLIGCSRDHMMKMALL